ncbi:DivIVA domain-containing protein [Knoellia sp. S7-12]|uniref:DivIVA domain-containing protein n=1 Tax=Knoellia sp. S7-12 TaxID=3126698 RepID=UPI003368C370
MNPATLAETVRNAVFRSTQFRAGYDEGAVDDLLDELVRAVENGSSGTEVAAIASSAKLPTTSMRRGYDTADVDEFLGEVVRQASDPAATSPRTPAPASVPVTASQGRSGLGARLLRVLRGD